MIKEGTCKICGWEENELFNGMCFSCLAEKTTLKKLNNYKKSKSFEHEMFDFYFDLIGERRVLEVLEKELFKNADIYKKFVSNYIANEFSDWELEELAEMVEEEE